MVAVCSAWLLCEFVLLHRVQHASTCIALLACDPADKPSGAAVASCLLFARCSHSHAAMVSTETMHDGVCTVEVVAALFGLQGKCAATH